MPMKNFSLSNVCSGHLPSNNQAWALLPTLLHRKVLSQEPEGDNLEIDLHNLLCHSFRYTRVTHQSIDYPPHIQRAFYCWPSTSRKCKAPWPQIQHLDAFEIITRGVRGHRPQSNFGGTIQNRPTRRYHV
jgi:hypothetical protein